MSEAQLQFAKTFQLLIVASADRELASIIDALAAAKIAFDYNLAIAPRDFLSRLHQNSYDAILFSDDPQQEFSPRQGLNLLQQAELEIPFIIIIGAGSDRPELDELEVGVRDYIFKESLEKLPRALLGLFSGETEFHRAKLTPHAALSPHPILPQLPLSQTLRDYPNLDDFLPLVANLLRETLELRCCSFLLPDREGRMEIRYCSGEEEERDRIKAFIDGYQTTLVGGQPLILSGLEEHSSSTTTVRLHHTTGKILLMPVLYQQSYVGLIYLSSGSDRHQWTEEVRQWVASVAAQCAIAIHQAQLSERLQQHASWYQLLNRISATLNSGQGDRVILPEILKQVGEHFAVDRVILLRVEEETLHTEVEWRKNSSIPSLLDLRVPAKEWQEELAPQGEERVSQYFYTANCAEVCAHKEKTAEIIRQSQTHCAIAVPIVVGDCLFAALSLQTVLQARGKPPNRPRTFDPEEISILRPIANQIALAIAAQQQEQCLKQEVEERTQHLEAANQAKSELLSTMSHELRTPLTSIIGFARVLLEQIYGELNEKQHQYLNAIAESGEHLLSLINDLLDISKIEANKEELYLETLSVEEVCLSSLAILQEKAHQGGLELNLEIHPSVAVCQADRRRLKQILVNLLSNAIKFTERGSVTLKVEPQGDWLAFSAIDTGIGISETDLQNLFQPFQQVKTRLHRKHRGTGLGLALSRKLARLHGGDLIAHSEVGKGSCFTLQLPT